MTAASLATARVEGCPLCEAAGGRVVFEAPAFRVVHASEAGFPAFYRVVWRDHVAEFTDLSREQRVTCIGAVAAVEQALRSHLAPTKINLATLARDRPFRGGQSFSRAGLGHCPARPRRRQGGRTHHPPAGHGDCDDRRSQ
jgi:hypothetical protein